MANYTIQGEVYPVAIYGNGESTTIQNVLTKRQVSDMSLLADETKIEHIYCDDKFLSGYVIVAFYEKDKTEPTLMLQIFSNNTYSINTTKEIWLTYLGILNPKIATIDYAPNFNWTKNITSLDHSKNVDEKILNEIISNRNGINDRTDRNIYGQNVIKSYKDGFVYFGKKDDITPEFEGNSFIKSVREKLWKELQKEGNASSINAYDGQQFTWGKGFAAGGQLEVLVEKLLTNNNYKEIFQNMGIKLVNKHLWVVDDNGNWLKDEPSTTNRTDMTGYKASIYIRNNTKMLSFFAEFAEKEDYCQDFVNAQYELLKNTTMKIPSCVVASENSTAYEESWDDETATVLFHLSHWLPAGGWNFKDYSDTKGKMEKILYKYILNVGKSVNKTTYEDQIYKWASKFNILRSLEHFGIPKGSGLVELENTWKNNLFDLKFDKDKDNKPRVIITKTDIDPITKKEITKEEYITNSKCILIKKDNKFYIITKDGENVTSSKFEKQ